MSAHYEFYRLFPTALGLAGTAEAQSLSGITEEDRERFVKLFAPLAQTVGKRFNLNPLIILAQAALESAWGTSYMAKNINNFFGFTAYGNTNEYWKGQKYISKTSGLPFRVYKDAAAGFADFARLITTKYKSAAAVSNDVAAYASKIAYSPYISEKNGDNRELYRSTIINNAKRLLDLLKKYNPQPWGWGLRVCCLQLWQGGASISYFLNLN